MAIEWLKSWVVRDAPRGDGGRGGVRKKKHRKDFDGWSGKKRQLNQRKRKKMWFREGEIWWASVGCNIGCEIDGKSSEFSRPVLILRRISAKGFWGVPLTNTVKNLPGWHKCKNGRGSIVFEQIRFYDTQRLLRKKGTMDAKEVKIIQQSFMNLAK